MNPIEQDVVGNDERKQIRIIGAVWIVLLVAFAVWESSATSMRLPVTVKSLLIGTAWLIVPPLLLAALSFTPFDFTLASMTASDGLLSLVLFPYLSFVLWLSTGHFIVMVLLSLVGLWYLALGYSFYRNSSSRASFVASAVALAVLLGYYFSFGVSIINQDVVLYAAK